jgi:hypothetical protein
MFLIRNAILNSLTKSNRSTIGDVSHVGDILGLSIRYVSVPN